VILPIMLYSFPAELQPVSNPETFSLLTANTQDVARLDIVMNGFWGGRSEGCHVDVRVFNPYAPSNVSSFPAAFKWHENVKHRAYGQRIREVEHASFTPIVLAATGRSGLAQEASYPAFFTSRLVNGMKIMGWLHSFSFLRSTIQSVDCMLFLQSLSSTHDGIGKGIPSSPGETEKLTERWVFSVLATNIPNFRGI